VVLKVLAPGPWELITRISIDQIVLSADRYLTIPPGATKSDATILLR